MSARAERLLSLRTKQLYLRSERRIPPGWNEAHCGAPFDTSISKNSRALNAVILIPEVEDVIGIGLDFGLDLGRF